MSRPAQLHLQVKLLLVRVGRPPIGSLCTMHQVVCHSPANSPVSARASSNPCMRGKQHFRHITLMRVIFLGCLVFAAETYHGLCRFNQSATTRRKFGFSLYQSAIISQWE